jgi:hypothetical protein
VSLHHLPENQISGVDHKRLDSFCGHLVASGFANGWHWDKGGAGEQLIIYDDPERTNVLARIGRDRTRGKFYVTDEDQRQLAEGSVHEIMTLVDRLARDTRHR